MAGLGFAGKFVSGMAAQFQGQEMLADLDEKKADTENRKADTQMKQMQVLQQKQKADGQKDVADWMKVNALSEAQGPQDDVKRLQAMQKGGDEMLAKGDMAGYDQMQGLIKTKAAELKEVHVQQVQQQTEKKEALAQSATAYMANQSPQQAELVVKAAVAAGVDPTTIPKPGDLKLPTWIKQQQMSAMSAKDQMEYVQKQGDLDRSFTEKKAEHEDKERDHHDQMAATAQNQAAMRGIREEGLSLRKEIFKANQGEKAEKKVAAQSKADLAVGDKITKETQKEAAPMMKDLNAIKDVEGYLQGGGSSVGDQQIHQLLTSLQSGTGRATNLYYKGNANFGSFDEKVSGFLSKSFTGRYSDEQRREIYDTLMQRKTALIEPALTQLETQAKARATKYGISPDLVEIEGDFDRKSRKSYTENNGRAAGGMMDETGTAGTAKPAKAPAAPSAGTVEAGDNGIKYKFKGGDPHDAANWEKQ